jgi:peptidyl-tRNA hydrolase, PTH1 family
MENKIKVLIGLGNPGSKFENTRHNIGFKVLDVLTEKNNSAWKSKGNMELASCMINDQSILLIKPQTFMNNSGSIVPYLHKLGIKPENYLVIHDELELPFGKITLKQGGSAKGHNGLKSMISQIGEDFLRLRFGIGRPAQKEDVPTYVLQSFNHDEQLNLSQLIDQALTMIEKVIC